MTVAVVGAGITGLAAAWELRQYAPEIDVVVLEASEAIGGKLRTSQFAGRPVDEGADAFLARTPAAIDLCRELGLADRLVSPATGAASIWVDGALRPLPAGHVLGVPTDLDAAAATGILTPAGVARARADLARTEDDVPADETVGALVRRRLGDEVLERLVGPLVGGINAGDADVLSVRAVTPQLAAAADTGPSLIAALRAQRDASPAPGPVFLTLPEGLGTLATRLAGALANTVDIRTSCPAVALERSGTGWAIATPGGSVRADVVIVATPGAAAASLVAGASTDAASLLGAIPYASVALVTMVLRARDVPMALDGSGFLVPRDAGLTITACSWFTSKWAHLADGDTVVLRAAVGRHENAAALALDDGALVARVGADLAVTMGISAPPSDVRVSRWPGSFPQYTPGHLDRVDAIDATLARETPGVLVAGAALRGLGVPACIEQGRRAARHGLAVS